MLTNADIYTCVS